MEEFLSRLVDDARQSLDTVSSLWDEIGQDLEQRTLICREIEHELKRVFTAKIQDAQETKAQIQLRIRLSGVRIKSLRDQLNLPRETSLESEDVDMNVQALPLRQVLGHLESTLLALDESKSTRIALLNSKSETLMHLINNLDFPLDEELQNFVRIDTEGDLSTSREQQLDARISELHSVQTHRALQISAHCDRMKAMWESLGVEFLGSDTDALDVQVLLECGPVLPRAAKPS